MKKSIFLSLMLLLPMVIMSQTRKVAILETVDFEKTLPYGVKLMIRGKLAEAVTNTPGYEAYDRTNLQQIFDEQEFQRTGFVSESDIKKIGEMTGVQYVLVTEAGKIDNNTIVINAKILNVETARVEKTANTMAQMDSPSLQRGAQELASRLLSEIKPSKSAISYATNGVKPYIERINYDKYLIGEQYVDRRAYYRFIQDNRTDCTAAYREYIKGYKMTKIGWSLLGIGCGIVVVGGACWGASGGGIVFDNGALGVAGFGVLIAGTAVTLSGLSVLCVGYSKKNNAYMIYNDCSVPKNKKPTVTFNLQSSRNGLGLALCF